MKKILLKILIIFITVILLYSCAASGNSTDVVKPTINITSPENNSNSVTKNITITGEVQDNKQVIEIEVSVNNNNTQLAQIENGEWSIDLLLEGGENAIKAKAIDSSGNESDFAEISLFAEPNNVYVAGYKGLIDSEYYVACFWKNGERTDLISNPQGDSEAKSIVVVNNNVYTAGYYNNGTHIVACYWINDTKYDLEEGLSVASSISVIDNDIYISGRYADGFMKACYWKNGIRTDLGTSVSTETSIFVERNDVYVAGSRYNGNYFLPCYWKNGTQIDFPTTHRGTISSIFIKDSDIYFSGYFSEESPPGINYPSYWKNNTINTLSSTSFSSTIDIAVNHNGIHVIGSTHGAPSYWLNGTKSTLNGLNEDLSSIFLLNEDVYISGENIYHACYYLNGRIFQLEIHHGLSNANDIYVF